MHWVNDCYMEIKETITVMKIGLVYLLIGDLEWDTTFLLEVTWCFGEV